MRIALRAIIIVDDNCEVRVYSPGLLEIENSFKRTRATFGKYTGELVDLALSKLVLVPRHINAHVHVLDYGLRHYFHTYYIDDVVGAPFGLKYLYLRTASRAKLSESIKRSLAYMYSTGTGKTWIVLESGLALYEVVSSSLRRLNVPIGVELFLEPSKFHLLPDERPDEQIMREVREIVQRGHNVELISPLNYAREELEEIRRIAHSSGKLIMTHVSETSDTYQEGDLDLALDVLDADILVHCCYIDKEDVEKLRGKIIVITPRSNLRLAGKLAPLQEIVKRSDELQGILLGTDNVGLYDPNMWDEYSALARIFNKKFLYDLFARILESTCRFYGQDLNKLLLNGQLVLVRETDDILTSIIRGEVVTAGVLVEGQVRMFGVSSF